MTRKAVLASVVLLLGASLAGATTLTKMEFTDLVRDADQIVVGTVTGIEGEWDDSLRFIHSNVTLSVEQTLWGEGSSVVVLRTPGGQVGGMGQRVEGAPTFRLDEKVLVFLTTWEDGTPKVLGYVQGKARVFEDEEGRLRLEGGVMDGRSLESVAREIHRGPDHNIPLRPVR